MSNLIYGLLIALLCSTGAQGAYFFNGTSNYITVTDNAALDRPDGDWTAAGWVKLDNNTGSAWNACVDWLSGGATEMRFWIGEASHANYANDFVAWMTDDNGDAANPGDGDNNNHFSGNTDWTHLIIQRSGASLTIYKNNGSSNSRANASFDGIAIASNMYFGAADTATTQFLNGSLAEWAFWNRALTADERAGIAKGISPKCYGGTEIYFPMVREYFELYNNLVLTNNDSNITDHPRILLCD
jgi:hypothetical protein